MKFPKCYLLTTHAMPWRNEAVEKRFAEAGLDVEPYYGVHGSTVGVMPVRTCLDAKRDNPYRINPGKMSITISKMLLWEKILNGPDDEVIIFENDVRFVPNFKDEFAESYAALGPSWECAMIGWCCGEDKPRDRFNNRIYYIRYPLCCHAVMWRKSGLRYALDVFKKSDWANMSDAILERSVYPNIHHCCFVPALAFTDETLSEATSASSWEGIQGWFDYAVLFDEFLDRVKSPAVAVEVGAWLGRSNAYFAEEIKRRLKPVTFYAVDTWKGSASEPTMKPILDTYGGDLYDQWQKNMSRTGVWDYVKPMRMTSLEASAHFADSSVDFIFIDGDHETEAVRADIRAWLPKLKPGGWMGGHDYPDERVKAAVKAELGERYRIWDRCWIRT